MTTPNDETMPLDELRQYVLAHRSDQEAFHAYSDRSKASGRMITIDPTHPAWKTKLSQRIQRNGE